MYIPAPPAPRRSWVGAIFTTLAVTLLGCSLTLNFWLLVAGGLAAMAGGQGPTRSDVVLAGDVTKKVYQIDVTGVIDDQTEKRIMRLLKQAEDDSFTQALLIHIDTPGGTVTASDNIYQALRSLKTRKNLPVVITQGGLATSGGYYISAAGDKVFASRTTLTGNIGVIMQRFNVSKLMEKYGIEDATIISSGADFKDAGSMFKPEDPKERAYLQSLMDSAFVIFKQVVKDGRGAALTQSIDTIANGKVYTAAEAKQLGLVDGTGGHDEAVAYLKTLPGLASLHLVKLEEPPSLASLFGVKSNLSGSDAKLEISRSLLESVVAPRPLYLWRGQ